MKRKYPVFRSFSHFLALAGIFFIVMQAQGQGRKVLEKGKESARSARYDSAILYFSRAAQSFTSVKDSAGLADSFYESGLVYALQSKYKESIVAQQKAFVLYQKTGNSNGAIRALNSLGSSHLKTKKYPQAKEFYSQAVERAQRNAAFEELAEAYDGLANVFQVQNDLRKALTYVRLMQGAHDSIAKRDHQKELNELEEKYSNLLEEKDRQLVQAEAQHRQVRTQGLLRLIERDDIRLQFYAVALALGFLVLCLTGLWWATRRTARSTELTLRREQSATRTANEQFEIISRQIHDQLTGSLNDISFSTSELATLKAHNEITSAALHVRAIGEAMINNMMDLVWLINPNNRSLESLITYIRDQTNALLKPSGINYMIVFPDRVPNVQLTSLERVNLFFVTHELLRYSIETSKATGLTLSLTVEGRQLIFKVKDNSTPVDEALAKKRGEEIKPLRERMEQIDGTIGLVIEQGAMVVIYRKDLP